MEVLAILPARSGSQRIKGKNTRLIAGRPLLAWTCMTARESRYTLRLVCSTDSEQIAAVARDCGAETPFLRPSELAADDVPTHHVEKHAVAWLDEHEGYVPDMIVRLQATSPLRLPTDIDTCIDEASGYGGCVSVEKICDHRYQTAVISDTGDLVPLYPKLRSERSQDVGDLYTWNGAVYAAELDYWRGSGGFFGYHTRAHVMPRERSIDIDTWEDWEEAEKMLTKLKWAV